MAIAVVTTLVVHAPTVPGTSSGSCLYGLHLDFDLGRSDLARHRHRRRHRPCHRPQDPDDGDAAAGRGLSQPRRHGRGAGRGRRVPQPRQRSASSIADRTQSSAASRVEMGLGVAIGAITFSGSVIAFLKLNGNMSGKPILLPARHGSILPCWLAILASISYFTQDSQSPWISGLVMALGFRHRLPADHPDRRRRHAGRDLDAEQLFGLGRGGDGLHAAQQRDDHHRRAGRQLGRDPQLHHVPGDEPQLHLGHRGRLRRRCGRRRRRRGRSTAPTSAARPKTRPS